MNSEKIKEYKKRLKKRDIKTITQNYYLIGLRSFLKFLKKHKEKALNPEKVGLLKHKEKDIKILNSKEIEKIRNFINQDLRGKRNRAVFETLLSTGIKVSELCRLNKNTDLRSGVLIVKNKDNKERTIHVPEKTLGKIKEYLKERKDQKRALFVSLTKKGKVLGRITPRSVQRLINKLGRTAEILNVTPQILRHSFATDLFKKVNLVNAKEILGHTDISVTKAYKKRLTLLSE